MDVREFVARLGLEVDEEDFGKGDERLALVKKGIFGIQAAAVAAVGALGAAVGFMAKAGGHIDDLSKGLDIDAESLQSLAYAGKFSGVGLDEMAQSLAFLGKNAYAATQGSQAQTDAFNAMGISVTDAKGRLKGSDELFRAMADGLAKIPDAGQRTQIAMTLMGRAGKQMLPTLMQGRAALEALEERARLMGYVMDKDTVAAADALGDSVDDLKFALTGLRNLIAGPLLEPMREVVSGITEWIIANRELIKLQAKRWAERIVTGFKLVVKALTPLIKTVIFLADHYGTLLAVMGGMGVIAATAAQFAIWFLEARKVLQTLGLLQWAASLFTLTTLGWVLAIAALIMVFEDLWVGIHGGDSEILNLMEDWSHFLDSLMADKADNWWLTKALKWVWRKLADIQGTYQEFAGWLSQTSIGKAFNASNEDLMRRAQLGQLTEYEKANGLGGGVAAYNPQAAFGAGATPGLSVAAATGVAAPAQVKVFQGKIELKTEVKSSNAKPEDIAKASNDALSNAINQAGAEMDEAT